MQRRDFLKTTAAVAVATQFGVGKAQAKVPAHNWASYDFGSGPHVTGRRHSH
jgi:anaerobic selenocysteine-containing dehydrogenase